jgi:hypothetical protein
MDGSAGGAMASHDPISGHFLPRNTEYRAKQQRLKERVARLRLEYDDSPLLVAVARHLDEAERGRTALTRTRASNAACRLLKQLARKPGPSLPATLEEYLANE